jgi:hypothetical protein
MNSGSPEGEYRGAHELLTEVGSDRAKIHLFSIDNLVVLLAAAGLLVDLKIKTAA